MSGTIRKRKIMSNILKAWQNVLTNWLEREGYLPPENENPFPITERYMTGITRLHTILSSPEFLHDRIVLGKSESVCIYFWDNANNCWWEGHHNSHAKYYCIADGLGDLYTCFKSYMEEPNRDDIIEVSRLMNELRKELINEHSFNDSDVDWFFTSVFESRDVYAARAMCPCQYCMADNKPDEYLEYALGDECIDEWEWVAEKRIPIIY
jgi:hypothetical protein